MNQRIEDSPDDDRYRDDLDRQGGQFYPFQDGFATSSAGDQFTQQARDAPFSSGESFLSAPFAIAEQ
jgi:hypothetical protein